MPSATQLADYVLHKLDAGAAAAGVETLDLFLASSVPEAVYFLVSESIRVSRTLDPAPDTTTVAICIKGAGQVAALDQVDLLVLHTGDLDSNFDIFSKVKSLLNYGLLPMFELTDTENSTLTATRKHFSQLELSLSNLQEKIHVPNLLLSVHPSLKSLTEEVDAFDDQDSTTLNEVTNIVNDWIKQIQSVTRITNDISSQNSVVDEIQFWQSFEVSLNSIQDQISSHHIKNSINLLNSSKRFHVTLSFTNDIHLLSKLLETKTNLSLIKDLPVAEVLHSKSLGEFNDSVAMVFSHLKKLRTVSEYPLVKSLQLVELILKDITAKLESLIVSKGIMTLELDEFIDLMTELDGVFSGLDGHIRNMVNLIRELLRKRQEKFIIVRINQDSIQTMKERLDAIKTLRLKHENLLYIIRNFLKDPKEETNLMNQYNRLAMFLDFTLQNTVNWENNHKMYTKVFDSIQSLITDRLDEIFADREDFKSYVLIVDKYKYLKDTFVLLNLMREDLRLKVLSVANKELRHLAKAPQDQPYIAKYLRQLHLLDKVNFYKENLVSLVGEDWFKYSIGIKLQAFIEQFEATMDPELVFKEFLDNLNEFMEKNDKKIVLRGSIFNTKNDEISLNLSSKLFEYNDNVKFFKRFGKIPSVYIAEFEKFRKLIPVLNSLIESLKLLKIVFNDTNPLLLQERWHIKQLLVQLNQWEGITKGDSLRKFQDAVNGAAVKLNTLRNLSSYLDLVYYDLKVKPFESVEDIIRKAKVTIMDLYPYDKTDLAEVVNQEITTILVGRLQEELAKEVPVDIVIEVKNTVVMSPPVNSLKSILIETVSLKIKLVEQQVLLLNQVARIPEDSDIPHSIDLALQGIDNIEQRVLSYYNDWNLVGATEIPNFTTLNDWYNVVVKNRELKGLFESNGSKIGGCNIILKDIRPQIYSNFTEYLALLIKKFSQVLQADIKKFLSVLNESMKQLNFDTINSYNYLNDLILFIDIQQNDWKEKLELYNHSYSVLGNFKYPTGWIFQEEIENQISKIESIIEKKQAILKENDEVMKIKINNTNNDLNEGVLKFEEDWNIKKPISGDLNSIIVLNLLSNFESKCKDLINTHEKVSRIAAYLNIGISQISNKELFNIKNEIFDFKQVWSSINSLNDQINKYKKLKWSEANIKDVRQKLTKVLEDCRQLPIKIRQYPALDKIQQETKDLLQQHKYLLDLKNENIKDRHWKKFLNLVGYNGNKKYQLFTLEDIWNLNLPLNDNSIKLIVEQANNEHILEENVEKIKVKWQETISFEYFHFEHKYKLIKSWNYLFDQISQDLNELTSMRNSTSFINFEQDITSLETKLNSMYVLFDTWIEVQRQWVYLSGMFDSKSNISNILPLEASRFNNITYNFNDIMKKVHKTEYVVDVLLIPDLETNLNKLSDSLVKVRKSLTDFLENQRDLFPRFYFVGNEDLLELIGSGTDFTKINTHIGKIFPNIGSLEYDSINIVSFTSIEGEKVKLKNPISLLKHQGLVDWLSQLDVEIKITLELLIEENINSIRKIFSTEETLFDELFESVPSQVFILCCKIVFTELNIPLERIGAIKSRLNAGDDFLVRRKAQALLIELIHQEDLRASKDLVESELKYFYYPNEKDPLKRLIVKQYDYEFVYGFEYLGVPEKLVYTPLVSDCFVAMTQALGQKLGGSPFGPAGTGKTETVKALGDNLGRLVTVICCDESFDYQAMNRMFLGLCKVGCWGCFDEFNRLDEKILSAVSSQIENILHNISKKDAGVDPNTGIFVTMNPGYVGRNELPENLKKLFRSFSMKRPDKSIIVDVILASQGFKQSKDLSHLIVPFIEELEAKVSNQSHYDFGLRAVKSILNTCGRLKRTSEVTENVIVLKSIHESILPKLVRNDEEVFDTLKEKYFSDVDLSTAFDNSALISTLMEVSHGLKKGKWIDKVLQLNEIQVNHHGIILVGDSGVGKSTSWKLLLESLQRMTGKEHVSYVIDAKVLNKETLYGYLDPVTREWADGLFTSILRKILANLRGEMLKTSWIVFDGDIDPEWAENLNSVLDDNKILTLPNGERLELPPNVRIVFETDSLEYTTLATISRCGMVWFDPGIVDVYANFEKKLYQNDALIEDESDIIDNTSIIGFQSYFFSRVKTLVTEELLKQALDQARGLDHIMEFTVERYLNSLVDLVKASCRKLMKYCIENNSFDKSYDKYIDKSTLLAIIWSFTGDSSLQDRVSFNLRSFQHIEQPDVPLIDVNVSLPDGDWIPWSLEVQPVELEPHQVTDASTVIETVDTIRHRSIIDSVLNQHKPLLLCGPPGSGKTMTFLEVLKSTPNLDLLQLNFSKDSSPDSLMKSLKQFCELQKTPNGLVFTPKVSGKWVVVFCDEINLPGVDSYGCQVVISLMRQMIEHKGFWLPEELQWVHMKNIQFVGACNSPKDPGRQRLSERFLRHATVIMVDYPGEHSLQQIYETFTGAVMKYCPQLRGYSKSITDAMIKVYLDSKLKLTPDIQSHYVYSPRELTRWIRGLLEALKSNEYSDLVPFLRLWYHEGIRLFYDRLIGDEEKSWTKELFRTVLKECFPFVDIDTITCEPLLFSDWLSLSYESVRKEELHKFLVHRLATFSEEEYPVDLVLYEDLLTYALRIDRVLRQPQGHMIMVGSSTSGKTTLAKFVAWMNGLKVVQLHVHSNYDINEFDKSLREILIRCAKGEQICYLIDEASIIETSFIERMNTLLANSEIPGLFEGDDFKELLNICLEESQSQGLLLDSNEELYKWFSKQISANLHVVFTLTELKNGVQIVSSPALFNRCVLSYMGDWSLDTMYEIGHKKLEDLPVDMNNYHVPDTYITDKPVNNIRDALINCFLTIHTSSCQLSNSYPSQFLSLIERFVDLFNTKQYESQETQRHTNNGLNKLRETVLQVAQLKEQLSKKQVELVKKDEDAKNMLNVMLSEQNEAERKQEFSITAKGELNKQEIEIKKRKNLAMEELELAEPAILEARRGVQNIKKQHLTEIRSMTNPPQAVKLTMESVCILIGYQVSTWRDVQLAIRRDDFIPSIVNYSNEEQLTSEIREYMEQTYLSRPDYTFEAVNRASKACGPLIQWVKAQLTYSSALEKVGPLREEVDRLEAGALKASKQVIALEEMVKELEVSIEKSKKDYTELIRSTESIRMEMEQVSSKINKSMTLIESLTIEKDRWKNSVGNYTKENNKLIGNTILISAFLTYCGEFDEKTRTQLYNSWKEELRKLDLEFDNTLSVAHLLPLVEQFSVDDELVHQNLLITKICSNPLIIDPSLQLLDLLELIFPKNKLSITSFLNESFVRDLENAVRFGGYLLVKDSEYYNAILDPILRNEVTRNGGRRMVKIGSNLIDYNTEFKLILFTRDSDILISPFVESRVTKANFTITSNSLESKVLTLSLNHTKPEIEDKRMNLIKLQSEYKVKLKGLESKLLNSLAQVDGSILDDVKVIEYLETLKKESKIIDEHIKESDSILTTIDEVRNKYYDIALHSSTIFEIIQHLNLINPFYSFELSVFSQIFTTVLEKLPQNMALELYKEAFAAISPSLVLRDKVVFALKLTIGYYGREIGPHFVDFSARLLAGDVALDVLLLDEIDEENEVIKVLIPVIRAVGAAGQELFDAIAETCAFLFTGVGKFSSKYDVAHFIEHTHKPLILASIKGYDPTFIVEKLNHQTKVISLGSKEGIELVKAEINTIEKNEAEWLVIQNIQMAADWLTSLEKLLQSIKYNRDTKVFLTCNLSSQIPNSLVNSSHTLIFENRPTLKSLMTFSKEDEPITYMHFLLLWYHSLICIRMNYVPVSFAKSYDINDTDLRCSINVIQKMNWGNIEKVLFKQIKYLIGEIIYGGKVDNATDKQWIVSLADRLFDLKAFEEDFTMAKGLKRPDGNSRAVYEDWARALPDSVPLEWIDVEDDSALMASEMHSILESTRR